MSTFLVPPREGTAFSRAWNIHYTCLEGKDTGRAEVGSPKAIRRDVGLDFEEMSNSLTKVVQVLSSHRTPQWNK